MLNELTTTNISQLEFKFGFGFIDINIDELASYSREILDLTFKYFSMRSLFIFVILNMIWGIFSSSIVVSRRFIIMSANKMSTQSIGLGHGQGQGSINQQVPLPRGSAIQKIYDNLINIPKNKFFESVSNPLKCDNIKNCLNAMNDITLQDLGFTEKEVESLDESVCANIAYNQYFNMAVFLIPKGHALPLHDHPDMTVLSKVIKGNLDMKSFTVIIPPLEKTKYNHEENTKNIDHDISMEAELVQSTTKTHLDPAWMLSPSIENIHEFRAASTCVIFDCLLPPYQEPERPCNYYKISSSTGGDINGNGRFLLSKVVEEPNNLPHTIDYPGFTPRYHMN